MSGNDGTKAEDGHYGCGKPPVDGGFDHLRASLNKWAMYVFNEV
jgi:hypothetical protein